MRLAGSHLHADGQPLASHPTCLRLQAPADESVGCVAGNPFQLCRKHMDQVERLLQTTGDCCGALDHEWSVSEPDGRENRHRKEGQQAACLRGAATPALREAECEPRRGPCGDGAASGPHPAPRGG